MLSKKTFYYICSLFSLTLLNFTIALAQEAAPVEGVNPAELQPPTFASSFAEMAPMFGIVFFIFYFMVVKPQQTKLRQQEELIKNLAKGASVLTSSGIIGRVAGIEKDYILLELAPNVKVRFQSSHIVKSIDPGAEKDSQTAKAIG